MQKIIGYGLFAVAKNYSYGGISRYTTAFKPLCALVCLSIGMYAASNDHIEKVHYAEKLRLAYAGLWRDLWELSREYKEHTLVQACRDDNWEKVKAMVDKHKGSISLDMADVYEYFPLWYAVESKRYDMIRFLIKHGACLNRPLEPRFKDVHALWHTGDTALFQAVYRCDLEAAEILLDCGADPNTKNRAGITPLIAATLVNDVEMAKLLLTKGADPNVQEKIFCIVDCNPHAVVGGDTPLMVAARRGSFAIIKTLLAWGANNVNAKNGTNQTVFSIAQLHGDNRIFDLLDQEVQYQEYDAADIRKISFVWPNMWID